MKIIFDSEEQMDGFIDMACPRDFGYANKDDNHRCNIPCKECLERFIEMEVGATHGL